MRAVFIIITIVTIVLIMLSIYANAQSNQLLTTYALVSRLGGNGANVTSLVDELNTAINLYQEGYISNATLIAENVLNGVNAMAPTFYFYKDLYTALILMVAIALVIIVITVYTKRKRLIGGLWLRFRGDYRVRPNSGRERTVFLNEEVLSVIVAILIIAVVFGAASSIIGASHEPFSAIALLNSNGKIGEYPANVTLGQPLNLYIFIYNHMDKPIWYVVKVYVTNSTGGPPLNITPVMIYQRILLNNESYIFPLTISLNSTGMQSIVAELWYYDPENLSLVYTGNYVQLWVNVTEVGGNG